jgi:putative spermidine/putrescine transport system permease protein
MNRARPATAAVGAMFVTRRHVHTRPRQIWGGIQDNIGPSVAAMATILIVVTLGGICLHFAIIRRRRQKA